MRVTYYLPYNILLISFIKEQGYELNIKNLYQDNQSAISMGKNCRNSYTVNSRHVNIF